MVNSYYDNQNEAQRFQPGERARASDVDAKFDQVEAGFDLLPTPASTGKGFSEAVKVGTATDAAHAMPYAQVLEKIPEWVNAQAYSGLVPYSYGDIAIGSDGITYRFVGSAPATGDDPVTSETDNWSPYGGGGTKTLGTLTASVINGETRTITLDDEIEIPVLTVLKEVVDTGVVNSAWNVAADGSNYDVENFAYNTSIQPSATSGDIILTLGSGAFSAADVGRMAVFNGGKAVVSATDGSATVIDAFNDTSVISAGNWRLVEAGFDTGGVYVVNTVSGFDDIALAAKYTNTKIGVIDTGKLILASNDADASSQPFVSIRSAAGVTLVADTNIAGASGTTYAPPVSMGSGTAAVFFGATVTIVNSGGTVVSGPATLASNIYAACRMLNGNLFVLTHAGGSVAHQFYILDSSLSVVAGPTAFGGSVSSNTKFCFAHTDGAVIAGYADGTISRNLYVGKVSAIGSIVSSPSSSLSAPYANGIATACINNAVCFFYDHGPGGDTKYSVAASDGSTLKAATTLDSAYNMPAGAALTHAGAVYVVYGSGSTADTRLAGIGSDYMISLSPTELYPSYVSMKSVAVEGGLFYGIHGDTLGAFRADGSAGVGGDAIINTHIPAITNGAGQIDSTYWADLNSMAATETLNGQTVNYAISTDARSSFVIVSTGAGARIIARNNAGTWEYNSETTYASEAWTAASRNSAFGALSDAMTVAANQMDSAQLAAAGDADFPATTDTLDLAIILYTDNASQIPASDGLTINYDANAIYTGAVPGTDYDWDHPDNTTVRIHALADLNIKARVI